MNRPTTRLASALAGATATAVVLAGTSGATHLGSLQLGHANTTTAQTSLTANLDTPVLKVVNQGGAAAVRGARLKTVSAPTASRSPVSVSRGSARPESGRSERMERRPGSTRCPGRDELDRPGRGRRRRQEHGRGAGPARDRERGRASTGGQSPKVANLDADLVDGFDSSAFLPAGAKAVDSDKLDGLDGARRCKSGWTEAAPPARRSGSLTQTAASPARQSEDRARLGA